MAISLSEQLESDIKEYLHKTFGTYFSSLDERFAADIKKDVISASDFHHEHYNDDDISIAFQRVTLGIDEGEYQRLRGRAIRDMKRTNGRISFKDALDFQKSV